MKKNIINDKNWKNGKGEVATRISKYRTEPAPSAECDQSAESGIYQ